MSDEFATEPPDIATGPADPTAAPATTPSTAGDPDIDSLLGEFDRSRPSEKAAPTEPAPQEPSRAAAPRAYSEDELFGMELRQIQHRAVLENVLQHQIATAERLHQEQLQRQEREDFAEVVDEAAQFLEGAAHIGDPKQFVTRWLLAESQLDPRLAEAWQHRRDSKEHQAYAVRTIKAAFKKMSKEVSRMPDPQATEDRALVSAAVRGASSKLPPAETSAAYARRVERMSDADFQAEADRLMGR
ncbi:hypothetical protein I6F36_05745 [Bradyrhizobium sp. BRP19]|uniref:hypothetical protein n=1 Tax=Bradyrhizobium sp. BRP19 TaxID=2793823 RepID=UPI001CD4BF8F|nr:hypothetical protein [Bradyrhizobium sp. BRP19]MCA1546306.1 hypothetical protein [Bradyrhizobium sp. BRP19]